MDPQAKALNDTIQAVNPGVLAMLSRRGKDIFFPKLGILAQSAEANGKTINATIGIALEEDGTPLRLSSVAEKIGLPPNTTLTYAPSPGKPDLRKKWKELLVRKNPSLKDQGFSLPVVTSALTHGLSMCGYLFCDPGDQVIVADLYWENYDLLFGNAYGAELAPFPTFTANGGFNVSGLESALNAGGVGKKIVVLNFPNNPTGYTPTTAEAQAIAQVLIRSAAAGSRVVVVIDDAYFGLVYETGVFTESIFTLLGNAHENLLAVKLDGPTKEDYVWGFRVGFMTYGVKQATPALYEALESKTGGAIRGNISNASHPAQSILMNAYSAPGYEVEKQRAFDLLKLRYETVKRILAAHPEYAEQFAPLPFNSGYFMCVKMKKADPEKVRQRLLTQYSTGVIVMAGIVRLAFSATPTNRLEALFDNMFKAARDVTGG